MTKGFRQKVYFLYRRSVSKLVNLQLVLIKYLPRGRFILTDIGERILGEKTSVTCGSADFEFNTPNWLTHRRAVNLLTDEPGTISWIDNFSENAIFWDIGANIGSYSIYAAVKKNCKVVAFEPSFLNLMVLQKNIELNGVMDKVTIFPVGLSDSIGIKTLYFSKENFRIGGAHNSLGVPRDQYGNPMFETYKTLVPAETMDSFILRYVELCPDYIKIDVDGLELEILQGARQVLVLVKEVSIEILGQNQFNESIDEVLVQAGLSRVTENSLVTRNVIYRRL